MQAHSSNGDEEGKRGGATASVGLLRRVFGDVTENGSEQHHVLISTMRNKAMADCKIRAKEGEYVEVDLYGRGDPRAFEMFDGKQVSNEEAAERNKRAFFSKLGGITGKRIRSIFVKLSGTVASRNTSNGGYVRTATSDSVDDAHALRE